MRKLLRTERSCPDPIFPSLWHNLPLGCRQTAKFVLFSFSLKGDRSSPLRVSSEIRGSTYRSNGDRSLATLDPEMVGATNKREGQIVQNRGGKTFSRRGGNLEARIAQPLWRTLAPACLDKISVDSTWRTSWGIDTLL